MIINICPTHKEGESRINPDLCMNCQQAWPLTPRDAFCQRCYDWYGNEYAKEEFWQVFKVSNWRLWRYWTFWSMLILVFRIDWQMTNPAEEP